MKYFALYVIINIILIAISFLIAGRIAKVKGISKVKHILLTIEIALLTITINNIGLLQIYYHADEAAMASLNGSEKVDVRRIGSDYFFDGPGKEKALIFIPGARVEETSYAPLLLKISEQGVDCFLMKVPSRMATFGLNAADRVTEKYGYDSFYLAGHSLGGIVAAFYSEEHSDIVDGLVLLASYPTNKIPDSIHMLSVYGNLDGCLSMESYEKNKSNWSSNSSEVIIDGGNHSYFGNYGMQRDDGEARISRDEQQTETAEAVIKFISNEDQG